MIVSIGKSFLFGIVFDAEALPEEERAAGRAHPGFPWFGQRPFPPRRALAGRR
jgi:hypothetical protein